MSLRILAGISLIILGLGETIFAQRIFDYFVRTDSSRTIQMRFDRWPPWMFPTWVWMMRFAGLLAAWGGLIMIIKNR
jgi:hypothetical protein